MDSTVLFNSLEEIHFASHLDSVFDQVLIQHNITNSLRVKRDEDSFTQTIFQVRSHLICFSNFGNFSLLIL